MNKEIVEGNKLIAEFMELPIEFKTYPNPQLNRWEIDMNNCWQPIYYHSSWDWLMPVVEKIEGLGFAYTIMFNYCHIWEPNTEPNIGFEIEEKKTIDAVWLAVVEFIKWYNNSKQ